MKLKYTLTLFLLLISIFSFSQPQEKKGGNTTSQNKASQVNKTPAGAQTKTTVRTNSSNSKVAEVSSASYSSPLTGVWRGFFTSGMGFFLEKYRYEIQLGQLSNNSLKGVTYSYKTTVFYGKANLAGMYTPSTKNLVIKENKLLEVKISNGDDACLMTCYLEYSKIGSVEILEGTFTSVNIKSKSDCGSGRVYLEKVPESDFYKEDFVKEFETKKEKKAEPKPQVTPKTTEKPAITKAPPVKKDPPVVKKEQPKKDPVITIEPRKPVDEDLVVVEEIKPRSEEPKKIVVPKPLKERENSLAKRIYGEGNEIRIDLYDNGQIDNDTISVYHNNQLVLKNKRLCHQPLTYKIKVDPNQPHHEFVMVAENLGDIPPNTALMIITIGNKRHELMITSTEQKNAMVIIECKVPSKDL